MAAAPDWLVILLVRLADQRAFNFAISSLISVRNCVERMTSFRRSLLIAASESVRSESARAITRSCSSAFVSHAASATAQNPTRDRTCISVVGKKSGEDLADVSGRQ
jgi:hypothetical protein